MTERTTEREGANAAQKASSTFVRKAPRRGGIDGVSVALYSLAAFLVLLALLGWQLGASGHTHARTASVLLRKVYRTTVVERVLPAGAGGPGGASVTQSESGSASGGLTAAPIATRTS